MASALKIKTLFSPLALVSAFVVSAMSGISDYIRVRDGLIPAGPFPILASMIIWFVLGYFVILQAVRFWGRGAVNKGTISWKRIFVLSFSAIFVSWMLLYVLPHFPGNMRDDTIPQLFQYDGLVSWYTQHPIFDSLVFGFFWDIGRVLDAPYLGLFLYVVIISALTAASVSASIAYAYYHGAPMRLVIGLVAVSSIVLVFFEPVQAMSKDSFNTWSFIFAFLGFVEIVRSRGDVIFRAWFIPSMVFVVTLCMISKRTMGIVCLVMFIALLAVAFLKWRERRKIALMAVIALVPAVLAFGVWDTATVGILNAQQNKTYEMYSVPVQQVTKALKDHPEELETIGLEDCFDANKAVQVFNPWRADEAWYCFRAAPSGEFLKKYIELGCKYPKSYGVAFLDLQGGWFSLDTPIDYGSGDYAELFSDARITGFSLFFQGNETRTRECMSSYDVFQAQEMVPATYRQFSDLVVINQEKYLPAMTSYGLWCFAVPFVVAAWCLTRKKGRALFAMLPLGLVFGTLIVGPLVLYWYAAPMVYCAPLAVCIPFIFASKEAAGQTCSDQS